VKINYWRLWGKGEHQCSSICKDKNMLHLKLVENKAFINFFFFRPILHYAILCMVGEGGRNGKVEQLSDYSARSQG